MFKKILYIVCLFFLFLGPFRIQAVYGELDGRILLQVEANGEAWYVSPTSGVRHYLGRPDDAFRIMREQGIGISNQDLAKIPTATDRVPFDFSFAAKHKGKIFLAVADKGRAWYVNPVDLRRYYLGRPADAFAVMQSFGLGISNADLEKIPVYRERPNSSSLEKRISELINQERKNQGLGELQNSDAIAAVAREHSDNLASENKKFTSMEKACDLPIIHHEGLDFGISHSERLQNRGLHDYSRSGENIALIAVLDYSIEYIPGGGLDEEIDVCEAVRKKSETDFKAKIDSTKIDSEKIDIIKDEIAHRVDFFNQSSVVKPVNIRNYSEEEIARKMVDSWMESPGHKKNILTAEYNMSGIGVAYIDAYVIATQVFTTKAECGYLNGSCCESGGCYLPNTCSESDICQ